MMTEARTPALAPHLICAGAAEAIEFYKKAFGATEVLRLPGPDGKLIHGAVEIEGAMVMLVEENRDHGALSPLTLGGTPVVLHLNVANVDAAIERIAAAGATIVMAPADMFWGDRYGQVRDPFGHLWSLAHPLGASAMTEGELREAALEAARDHVEPAAA
jgi:uncharacterized glyoxalase superfamily protein PhnB